MTDTTTVGSESVPDTGAAQLQALLDAQRAAFVAEGVPSAAVRRNRIERLTLLLLEHADQLTAALSEDFGNRPVPVSLNSDILGTLGTVHHILDNLEDWMKPVEMPGTREKGMPTVIQPKPKGVVGVIGPWNFPVSLVFQPAVEALAAGNRVMIKFSEIPARTATVFADAVTAEFDPTEVVVVLGGPSTAAQFSSLQFDHLFFTGSPAVGRKVGAAAGANLVPVTLELGGKNRSLSRRTPTSPRPRRESPVSGCSTVARCACVRTTCLFQRPSATTLSPRSRRA
jgi:coniferyl-aldehyde dehydrogenase